MTKLTILIPVLIIATVFSGTLSCNNDSGEIALPEKEFGYAKPVTLPLQFTVEKKLTWDTAKKVGIKPIIAKLDIDALPSKPFDSTGFKPFPKAPEEAKFDYNSLPDTAFDLDKLPAKPIQFKKFIRDILPVTKAGQPAIQKNKPLSIADFGVLQGLQAKFISCLFKDKQGLMWIGSGDGIYRYDGDRIETIVPKVSAPVLGMAEDRKGRIWYIHSIGIGMVDIPGGTISFSQKIGANPNSIAKITVDEKGLLWVYNMKDSAVSIIYPETLTYKNLDRKRGLSDKLADEMVEDENKNIWITTYNAGINIIDQKAGKIKYLRKSNGLRNDSLAAITIDRAGKIWVSSAGAFSGVEAIDVKNGSIKHYTQQQGLNNNLFVVGLSFDDKGRLWKSNTSGIEVIDVEKNMLRSITSTNGLAGDVALRIVQDNYNRVWAGTTTGINIIDQRAETVKPFGETPVTSMMEDELGYLWVATRGGLHIIDQKNKLTRYLNTSNGLSNDFVQSFFKYDHKMFVATDGGINIIDPVRKTIERMGKKEGLLNDTCYAVFKDNEGGTWITGPSNGIDRLDSAKTIILHTDTSTGLSDDNISDIREDKDGLFWMATFAGGINVINLKKGTVKYLNNLQALKEGSNKSLLYDKYGRMWIGTAFGIFIADTKKGTLTTITTKNGLASNQVLSLLEYNGSVIAGTNVSSSIITAPSPDEISATTDTLVNLWKISPLAKTEKLIREQTGSWNTDAITMEGKYLWGDKGITAVHDITANNDSVATYITGMMVMTQPQHFKNGFSFGEKDTLWTQDTFYIKTRQPSAEVYTTKELTWDTVTGPFNIPSGLVIPYNKNYIQFQFAQANLSRPDTTFYTYILEGIDKNWNAVTTNPYSQNYLNLPSGNYTFKVSSKGTNGKWSTPVAYSFTINPPWWRTWWAYLLYTIILGGMVWSFIQYRSRWLKQENQRLEEMVTQRTNELSQSIHELKTTQTQLIQSEKMASLGELTAGIAHEIQNPLNFVNNFSEVSVELAAELKDELDKIDIPADKKIALEDIVDDIVKNQEKINHHGKRADSIVKGMLQHSRSSGGAKEPTDINALADEYLRLSYHGLRAKDKSFNATMKTDFDKDLPLANVIPQDVGRAILNLFTNAFYSVAQKKTLNPNGYEPTVSVSTKKLPGKVEIRVKDNGMGVPQKVLDKIFQPFFTTKPTGQGTGLGLSLGYDIITKGHGGILKVETKEGEGAEFIIQLPL